MHTQARPRLSVARLVASWLSFTRWTFSTCIAQVQDLTEGGADAVKDTILDLGCQPPADSPVEPQPLPPLPPGCLAGALREEVERVLQRVSEVVNEEPAGCWSPRTTEQVLALFEELAQLALARALDLRVRAAEKALPGEQANPSDWLHRYRRMLAEEGRWPPAPDAATPAETGDS